MNRSILFLIFLLFQFVSLFAFEMNWEASTSVNVGSGPFAPSLIMANRAGTLTQSKGVYQRAGIFHHLDDSCKFSYSFGFDAYFQEASSVDYDKWIFTDDKFQSIPRRPAAAVIQQLFGIIKYRSLFFFAGMKEHERTFLFNPLSSGDLTVSNNARPIPQIRFGFWDFVDIPLTNHWVQIIGDIAYGKFLDSKWNEQHYNYFNGNLTTNVWFHYKRLHLRSNPDKPFVATVGMQHAAQFFGTLKKYDKGVCIETVKPHNFWKSFLNVFIQAQYSDSQNEGEALNFEGNHLGSWDLKFDYRLKNDDKISLYVMKPWEDGTGIGWQNGFDGVWGIAYKWANNRILKGAVFEYLDFTNQAGPFLHEPTDNIPTNTTGGDDYYNNFMYSGWANYGMSIGSPVLKSTIYNTDGCLKFLDNALLGFHAGVDGRIGNVDLRVLLSWKKSKGTPYFPRAKKVQYTSMMIGGYYRFPKVEGLSLNAQIGFDAGDLYPACFGSLLSLTYKGNILTK